MDLFNQILLEFSSFFFFLFIWKADRHRTSMPWFTPQNTHNGQNWARPEPKPWDSFQ